MHVSKMLKMFDVGGTVQPPTLPDGYETLVSMLNEIKQMSHSTSSTAQTTLNEKQANRLMDSIFEFNQTYFNEIPIADQISKRFVLNVPEEIFKQTIDCVDKEYDDILNPMMLFYVFLTDTDEYTYAKYLQILHRVMSEHMDTINELASEYDAYLNEEE